MPGVKLDYITKIPITIIDRIDTTEMYCFTRKKMKYFKQFDVWE